MHAVRSSFLLGASGPASRDLVGTLPAPFYVPTLMDHIVYIFITQFVCPI
jgi:hypothetical protein